MRVRVLQVSEAVSETVQQLAQGSVPRSWRQQRVELASDNIAVWLMDLQVGRGGGKGLACAGG